MDPQGRPGVLDWAEATVEQKPEVKDPIVKPVYAAAEVVEDEKQDGMMEQEGSGLFAEGDVGARGGQGHQPRESMEVHEVHDEPPKAALLTYAEREQIRAAIDAEQEVCKDQEIAIRSETYEIQQAYKSESPDCYELIFRSRKLLHLRCEKGARTNHLGYLKNQLKTGRRDVPPPRSGKKTKKTSIPDDNKSRRLILEEAMNLEQGSINKEKKELVGERERIDRLVKMQSTDSPEVKQSLDELDRRVKVLSLRLAALDRLKQERRDEVAKNTKIANPTQPNDDKAIEDGGLSITDDLPDLDISGFSLQAEPVSQASKTEFPEPTAPRQPRPRPEAVEADFRERTVWNQKQLEAIHDECANIDVEEDIISNMMVEDEDPDKLHRITQLQTRKNEVIEWYLKVSESIAGLGQEVGAYAAATESDALLPSTFRQTVQKAQAMIMATGAIFHEPHQGPSDNAALTEPAAKKRKLSRRARLRGLKARRAAEDLAQERGEVSSRMETEATEADHQSSFDQNAGNLYSSPYSPPDAAVPALNRQTQMEPAHMYDPGPRPKHPVLTDAAGYYDPPNPTAVKNKNILPSIEDAKPYADTGQDFQRPASKKESVAAREYSGMDVDSDQAPHYTSPYAPPQLPNPKQRPPAQPASYITSTKEQVKEFGQGSSTLQQAEVSPVNNIINAVAQWTEKTGFGRLAPEAAARIHTAQKNAIKNEEIPPPARGFGQTPAPGFQAPTGPRGYGQGQTGNGFQTPTGPRSFPFGQGANQPQSFNFPTQPFSQPKNVSFAPLPLRNTIPPNPRNRRPPSAPQPPPDPPARRTILLCKSREGQVFLPNDYTWLDWTKGISPFIDKKPRTFSQEFRSYYRRDYHNRCLERKFEYRDLVIDIEFPESKLKERREKLWGGLGKLMKGEGEGYSF